MIQIKKRLIPFYEQLATNFSNKTINTESKNIAYVFLVANYNNVGDLAINYAQEKFIQRIYPDYEVVSIPVSDTYVYLKDIKKKLKSTDLIFTQGGGSFGDLYPKADYGRLFLCKYFSNHDILSFPQTMVFTKTDYGRWRLKNTQKRLKKEQNFTLFAREKISYEMMKSSFIEDKVKLSPDVVLSLLPAVRESIKNDQMKRKSVVVTLRADGEKQVTYEQQQLLQDMIEGSFNDVIYKDTEFPGKSPNTVADGYAYVLEMFEVYKEAKVVVTDRLHGMIFACVTGTPCIVLPNSNHKISETYKNWLVGCNYIEFIDSADVDTVKRALNNYTSDSFRTNYDEIDIQFNELENAIKSLVS